jgi:hypothetical protein
VLHLAEEQLDQAKHQRDQGQAQVCGKVLHHPR